MHHDTENYHLLSKIVLSGEIHGFLQCLLFGLSLAYGTLLRFLSDLASRVCFSQHFFRCASTPVIGQTILQGLS